MSTAAAIRMGDIGEGQREYEVEPLTEPLTVPTEAPVTTPAEEPVPA
jgi:hypothetical protein